MSVHYEVDGWVPVIGLEVHCQLKTRTKIFSACGLAFGAPPNSQTDAYTWGMPGTLPVPNRQAIDFAIRLGLAADCDVQERSAFARKHYFYPDLPKGYQITQSDHPYALGGTIEIPAGSHDAQAARIRLVRIHLEEDAGKNVHVVGEEASLVDYNRAGTALVEIVSEPDLRSPAQAAAYLRELRAIIRHLGISDANMEQGSLRCDANVSIRKGEDEPLGTRCEIKNLNSFKFLEDAIAAEIRRQVDCLESGGSIVQSTMSYDPGRKETRVMRTKEDAADYRYFPDPDLPPLLIERDWIERVRSELAELPAARRQRYSELGLSAYDADVVCAEPSLARFFDAALEAGAPAKSACNWVTGQLLGRLNADGKNIDQSPVSPLHIRELVALIDEGKISSRAAKEVFDSVYAEGVGPAEIVERDGHAQVSDISLIEKVLSEVLAVSPKQVEQFRQGKTKVRGYFVGQVMQKTRGQANPKVVNEVLDRLLEHGQDPGEGGER